MAYTAIKGKICFISEKRRNCECALCNMWCNCKKLSFSELKVQNFEKNSAHNRWARIVRTYLYISMQRWLYYFKYFLTTSLFASASFFQRQTISSPSVLLLWKNIHKLSLPFFLLHFLRLWFIATAYHVVTFF